MCSGAGCVCVVGIYMVHTHLLHTHIYIDYNRYMVTHTLIYIYIYIYIYICTFIYIHTYIYICMYNVVIRVCVLRFGLIKYKLQIMCEETLRATIVCGLKILVHVVLSTSVCGRWRISPVPSFFPSFLSVLFSLCHLQHRVLSCFLFVVPRCLPELIALSFDLSGKLCPVFKVACSKNFLS